MIKKWTIAAIVYLVLVMGGYGIYATAFQLDEPMEQNEDEQMEQNQDVPLEQNEEENH